MSDESKPPERPKKGATTADERPAPDEGAEGLGYTARPTEHESEGGTSPGGGSGDATGK